jgi:hypothetical protein
MNGYFRFRTRISGPWAIISAIYFLIGMSSLFFFLPAGFEGTGTLGRGGSGGTLTLELDDFRAAGGSEGGGDEGGDVRIESSALTPLLPLGCFARPLLSYADRSCWKRTDPPGFTTLGLWSSLWGWACIENSDISSKDGEEGPEV